MVVRHDNNADLVVVTADDGRLYVLDGASLGGTNHRTPLHVTAAYTAPGAGDGLGDVGVAGHALDSGARSRRAKPGLASRPRPRTCRPDRGIQAGGNQPARSRSNQDGRRGMCPRRSVRSSSTASFFRRERYFLKKKKKKKMPPSERNRSTRAVLYALDGDTGPELWTSRARRSRHSLRADWSRARAGLPGDLRQFAVCVRSTDGALRAGGWRLAAGGWRLAAGGWRTAAGGWRLAAGGELKLKAYSGNS